MRATRFPTPTFENSVFLSLNLKTFLKVIISSSKTPSSFCLASLKILNDACYKPLYRIDRHKCFTKSNVCIIFVVVIRSYNITSCNNNMNKHGEYLEHVFHYFDEDGDGKISPSELRNRLGLMGGDAVELKEAEEAVESLDSDGDGFLGLEDLARLMELGDGEEEKMKDLRMAFEMYDVEGKGFITPKSLKRMLSRLGESRSVDECKIMINHFDLNGDGVLSFEEFRIMMQ